MSTVSKTISRWWDIIQHLVEEVVVVVGVGWGGGGELGVVAVISSNWEKDTCQFGMRATQILVSSARRVDNFIQRINPYPVDKIDAYLVLIGQRANFIHWIGSYPLDIVIHSSYNRALDFFYLKEIRRNVQRILG